MTVRGIFYLIVYYEANVEIQVKEDCAQAPRRLHGVDALLGFCAIGWFCISTVNLCSSCYIHMFHH